MSLKEKIIGISLFTFQLKESTILKQIDSVISKGAEVIILPRKNTFDFEKEYLSLLNLLVVFSPTEKMLKSFISDKPPIMPGKIPLVFVMNSGTKEHFNLLKYFSDLIDQKGIFFVPFGINDREAIMFQSRLDLISKTCSAALKNEQIKPVFLENHNL